MLKIILSGANGKMGKTISELCKVSDLYKVVAGIDPYTERFFDFPVFPDFESCSAKGDVIIDFSNAEGVVKLCSYAVETATPMVVATTGLSESQRKAVEKTAESIPVFSSGNMSLGMNLLIELAKTATKVLGEGWDIEIIEKHHNQKIDSPSGSALMIADGISSVLPYAAEYVYDRHNIRKKREQKEIGIHAVRAGTIVGEHSVIFAARDEVVEVSHSASSRDIFATGALKAAQFISCKSPGLYSMKELLSESV